MRKIFTAALTAFALGTAAISPVAAQDKPATILVLDASGSMWGQINGINKINIARDVVGEILSDFPDDQSLGFVTYGHRERGQCSDIQTIIEPAPGTAPEIVRIVNELNPRGMTPMTDAVIAAAQSLHHTEQAATVILVSDGIETCNPDPCAAARELEKAGIGFTAHVIGFDVKGEAEALMQMQCIAEETGGRFLTADNAQELSAALREVTAAEPTAQITLVAQVAPDIGPDPEFEVYDGPAEYPLLQGKVTWAVDDQHFNRVMETTAGNPLTVDLPEGVYIITAYSEDLDQFGQYEFVNETTHPAVINAIFPAPEEKAVLGALTLRAVLDSEDGPEITDPINWTISGPQGETEAEGSSVTLDLESGAYRVAGYHAVFESEVTAQLTFMANAPRTYTMVFATPKPTATLVAPDTAEAGSMIEIGWNGPGGRHDAIRIFDAEGKERGVAHTQDGNPLQLRMPRQGGTYELRYSAGLGANKILVTRPITVTDMDWSIVAPDSAFAGSVIEIDWVGPDGRHDAIRIFDADGKERDMAGTRDGNPVQLRMPRQGGEYELRYSFGLGANEVLVTRPITVTTVDWKLTAPDTAPAGSVIEIASVGPGGRHDLIRLYNAEGRQVGRVEPRTNDPVRLKLPELPGQYELRYTFGLGDKEVLATRSISLTAP